MDTEQNNKTMKDITKLKKATIHCPTDLFVQCPFCEHEQQCEHKSHICKCEDCKKEFYAEFSKADLL